MNDYSRLRSLFEEHDIILLGSLVEDASASGTIYAFVDTKAYASGRKVPSQGRLGIVSAAAREFGYDVIFVLLGSDKQQIQDNLEFMIRRKFSRWLSVAVTGDGSGANALNVWLVPKDTWSNEQEEKANRTINKFCEMLDVKLGNIAFLRQGKAPTQTALILTLRTIAPCTSEKLLTELQRQFSAADGTWIERRLDVLRKRKLVVRDSDGKYFLSHYGLDSLGTLKSRSGPDIRRALALARRGSNV